MPKYILINANHPNFLKEKFEVVEVNKWGEFMVKCPFCFKPKKAMGVRQHMLKSHKQYAKGK